MIERNSRLANQLRPAAALLVLLAAPRAGADLLEVGSQVLFQATAGGAEEAGDRFGAALAAGDFDGDGFLDLAIGVPDEGVGAIESAGAVFVVYGGPAGLARASRAPLALHQDVSGVEDAAEGFDRFGSALTVGDFNGDGIDDLAVGIPGENEPGLLDTGAVQAFAGSLGGLVPSADVYLSGATLSGNGGDALGAALAACDRNGDGRADLLAGAPGWSDAEPAAGRVIQLLGSPGGLGAAGATQLQPTAVDAGDRFGSAIDCGRLDGDGLGDLAVGAPFGDLPGGPALEGVIWLLPAAGAPTPTGGFEFEGEAGTAVLLADFGAVDTPVFGVPRSNHAGAEDAGLLILDFAGGGTLAAQDDAPFDDDVKPFDRFGEVLAAGDLDLDGLEDVVVGVPGENLNDDAVDPADWLLDAGLVHVDLGGGVGSRWQLEAPADCSTFAPEELGLPIENGRFGSALAVADFDGNGWPDLAAGAPGADCDTLGTGLVRVVYGWPPGWIFGDGFERGDRTAWSGTAP